MKRRLEYSILDVFAERPLEGNALAVVHDARGLSDAEMQAIARETNLSETTFVLPSDDLEQERREGVCVRIFTTYEELPFAGHPTLGTASWLYKRYAPLQGASEFKLRLNIGSITVRLQQSVAGDESVFATMWQNDAVFGEIHKRAEVAQVLGLQEHDLLEGAEPQTVSTGNPFCVVGLRSESLQRLAIPQREAGVWLAAKQTRWFYCVAPDNLNNDTRSAGNNDANPVWRARMQFYSGEDPATGSAAGCAIAWMVRHGWAQSGQEVILRQGVEIGRPSRILTTAVRRGEGVSSITVSGRTILVADGAFFLPVYRRFTQAREP